MRPPIAFDDVVYNNFDSTNEIENWGVSGQIDYELGRSTLTSITAYRGTDAVTNQDSDFTSADLLGRNFQDLRDRHLHPGAAARRQTSHGPVNFLLGAFYFNEKIDQANQLLLGTQFRAYANVLIQAAVAAAPYRRRRSSSCSARSAGNPATVRRTGSSPPARASTSVYELEERGLLDLRPGRLRDHRPPDPDRRAQLHPRQEALRHRTSISTDVFSGVDLPAMRHAGDRRRCRAAGRRGIWARPAPSDQRRADRGVRRGAAGERCSARSSARRSPARHRRRQPLRACARCSSCRRSSTCPTRSRPGETATATSPTPRAWPTTSTDSINVYAELRDRLQGELDQPVARQPADRRRPAALITRAGLGVANLTLGQPLRRAGEVDGLRGRAQGQLGRRHRPTSRCSSR